jgi:hypothetical protein
MGGRITLDEFRALDVGAKRERFDELSLADQLAFVRATDPQTMLLCGYPSEERILAGHGIPTGQALDDAGPGLGPLH